MANPTTEGAVEGMKWLEVVRAAWAAETGHVPHPPKPAVSPATAVDRRPRPVERELPPPRRKPRKNGSAWRWDP